MKTNLGRTIDLTEKRRTFVGEAVKGIDSEKRRIRAYASTNAWDRYGERFEADAFKDGLEAFKKNPVILFAHDYGAAPIGKAIDYEFDTKGLILTMEFADTDKAREVFKLYEGGFMSAFSVGFRPKEYRWEEREAGVTGLVFVKAELLENSAVPVPANPEAIVIKGTGGKTMAMNGDNLRSVLADWYMRDPYGPGNAKSIVKSLEHINIAIGMHELHMAEPDSATMESQKVMMMHMMAARDESMAAMGLPMKSAAVAVKDGDAAPAELPAPAEAPKSLKTALGYLIELGKTAREKGRVEDEAVRSMLTQAVNLCRELVYGPSTQSLDGMGDDGITGEQAAALVKEYELLCEKLKSSGRATQKDIDQLAALGRDIDELIKKSMKGTI